MVKSTVTSGLADVFKNSEALQATAETQAGGRKTPNSFKVALGSSLVSLSLQPHKQTNKHACLQLQDDRELAATVYNLELTDDPEEAAPESG